MANRFEYEKIEVPWIVADSIAAESGRSTDPRRQLVADFFRDCWPGWVERRLRSDMTGTSLALDATSRPAAAAIGTAR